MLAIGLPFSKYLMSLAQLILLGNWILEGQLKQKFSSFLKNKAALALSSLIGLHFLGLIYTQDFAYGFNDLRIKIPLLVFPLIISTSKPFSRKLFEIILQVFIASTLVATLYSGLILTDIIHRDIIDIRKISIFISHIRFGLLICIGFFISGYFLVNRHEKWKKLMWVMVSLWFLFFLVIMESMTGLSVLLFTSFFLAFYFIYKAKGKMLKIAGSLTISTFIFFLCYFVYLIHEENKPKDNFNINNIEWYTKSGNLYEHNISNKQTENGHYLYMYYCEKELKLTWNNRSSIKFNERDLGGNEIQYTLIRFLTSKNSRKDAEGVKALSNDEVKSIERGIPNVKYQNVSSLKGRLNETLWEIDLYRTTGDPNGHSLTQRFEYWKTAISIIKQNFIFGVGTGDVEIAFNQKYIEQNSPLTKEWRLRSHNQYLSIGVAFGSVGIIWFLFTLIYPMVKQKRQFDYLYITFLIIALVSFLNEDTLETQAGVTFYVFFNTIYLFLNREEEIVFKITERGKSLLFNKYA